MIMAFLLVVVVEGTQLPNSSNWLFSNVLTCNRAAFYIESGVTHHSQKRGSQKGVSAYCIPKTVPVGTKLWY